MKSRMNSRTHSRTNAWTTSNEPGRKPSRGGRTSTLLTLLLGSGLVVGLSVLALGTVSQARGGGATAKPTSTATASRSATARATPKDALVTSPINSAGCGVAPAIAAGTSGEVNIQSGGHARAYRLHVPVGYTPASNWPLVVDYHGGQSTDAMYERYTGQSADADHDGFIVAYPQGLAGPNSYGWGGTGVAEPNVDDVLFTSDLITSIQSTYCVDPHRIFVMGYSRGGGMASILACKLAKRIAAVAIVSGTYLATIENACNPARPIPILEFHGTGDTTAPYTGGGAENFLPVPQFLDNWVARDGCAGGPVTFLQQSGVTGEEWTDCAGGSAVAHYKIDGWGHQWMHGSGGTNPLDDTTVAWLFFSGRPLPQAAPSQH